MINVNKTQHILPASKRFTETEFQCSTKMSTSYFTYAEEEGNVFTCVSFHAPN